MKEKKKGGREVEEKGRIEEEVKESAATMFAQLMQGFAEVCTGTSPGLP